MTPPSFPEVQRRAWAVQAAVTLATIAVLAAAAVVALRPRAPAPPTTMAVRPFTVLGTAPFPTVSLPEYFLARFDPTAALPAAAYHVTATVGFRADSVTLAATLHQAGRPDPVAVGSAWGAAGDLGAVMDRVWGQLLGRRFEPSPEVTLPAGTAAIAAYVRADLAWRRGGYAAAEAGYGATIAADPAFAAARLKRLLLIAHGATAGTRTHAALRDALQYRSGLSPADSAVLDGLGLLLDRGDGGGALERFRAAAGAAPDRLLPWFVLGEFQAHAGRLFDQPVEDASVAFQRARDLSPEFAPAIAHLAAFAHLRGDRSGAQRLIAEYRRLDSTSVAAQVMGIADTLLFGGATARRALTTASLNGGSRAFDVLAHVAFQAAVAGSDADRRTSGRRVLAALERRAAREPERVLALRLGVAADLREGWADSARARLRRVTTPHAGRERDAWILLADVAGLDPLGDPAAAARRLAARVAAEPDTDAAALWLLALAPGTASAGAGDRLRALVTDGTPLAGSLALALDAHRRLSDGDTAGALAQWETATSRYDVLAVPFGLVASLWPQRLALIRVALAAGDTARAARACASFAPPSGAAEQAAHPEVRRLCGG